MGRLPSRRRFGFGDPLAAAAIASWLGTALAHVVATAATVESERIEWSERRRLFVASAALSTIALVARAGYRLVRGS